VTPPQHLSGNRITNEKHSVVTRLNFTKPGTRDFRKDLRTRTVYLFLKKINTRKMHMNAQILTQYCMSKEKTGSKNTY
jgi:hypothetical protein